MRGLLILCALAIGALSGCGGSDPVPAAQATTRRPLTVVIGDSLTAGYMPQGQAMLALRQDLSYTQELAQIGDVVTAAVGGAGTREALGAQVPWLRGLPADVLVIALGGNDAVQGQQHVESIARVRAIADAWPKARLVLIAPPRYTADTDLWMGQWAAELRTLANSRGAVFVDLYAASLQAERWYCHPLDRHPCAAAHREMGALVRSAIELGGR